MADFSQLISLGREQARRSRREKKLRIDSDSSDEDMKEILSGRGSRNVKETHERSSLSTSDDVFEDSQQRAFGSEDDGAFKYGAASGQGDPKDFLNDMSSKRDDASDVDEDMTQFTPDRRPALVLVPETQFSQGQAEEAITEPDRRQQQEPAPMHAAPDHEQVDKPKPLSQLTIAEIEEVIKDHFKEDDNGEEIAKKFVDEHINGRAMETLLEKEPESIIFERLGLSYGRVIMLKDSIRSIFGCEKTATKKVVHQRSKPTMAELQVMTPRRKHDYLKKRKRIGTLADEKWDGRIPSFRTREEKQDLEQFVSEIASQCESPAVSFTREGIKEHVKDYFYQQKRQRRLRGKCHPDMSVDHFGSIGLKKFGADKEYFSELQFRLREESDEKWDSKEITAPTSTPAKIIRAQLYKDQEDRGKPKNVFLKDVIDAPDVPPSAHEKNSKFSLIKENAAAKILKLMFGPEPIGCDLLKLTLKQIYKIDASKCAGLGFSELCRLLALKVYKNEHIFYAQEMNVSSPSRKDIYLVKKFIVQYG